MNRIEINTEELPDRTHLIKLAGKLDVFTFVEFKKFFDERFGGLQQILVAVDLGAVEYIASSGWSVLLSRRQAIKRSGGNLSIFGLNANLKRVYDSMKIQRMLPAADNQEEACKLLATPDAV
jgi:anti-anti-sigma factor